MRHYNIPKKEREKLASIAYLIQDLSVINRSGKVPKLPGGRVFYNKTVLYDVNGKFYVLIVEDPREDTEIYILERNKKSRVLKGFISKLEKLLRWKSKK